MMKRNWTIQNSIGFEESKNENNDDKKKSNVFEINCEHKKKWLKIATKRRKIPLNVFLSPYGCITRNYYQRINEKRDEKNASYAQWVCGGQVCVNAMCRRFNVMPMSMSMMKINQNKKYKTFETKQQHRVSINKICATFSKMV